MNPQLNRPPRRSVLSGGNFLFLLAVGALWAPLIWKMQTDWATNPQYGFGRVLPFFLGFLVVLRWRDRPLPEPAPSPRARSVIAGVGLLLLLLLLPLRIVQVANPDWRPLNWVHAVLVVGMTLLLIRGAAGRRSAWHFALPLGLIFFALPWPLAVEQGVIQALSRGVALATTQALRLLGIDAFQSGNLIHVPTGAIGIQDACSGIRSLAGTLMAAYFSGEFHRLTAGRRLLLMAAGISVAMGLNVVRAFALSWTAAVHGMDSISRWHDSAGLLIFGISFAILWFAADRLQGRHSAGAAPMEANSPGLRIAPAVLVAILFWVIGVEIFTETWFRRAEGKVAPAAEWNPVWPSESESFKWIKINDEARSILRYTDGISAVFKQEGCAPWRIFYVHWAPGRSSSQLATMHRPEICLPAAGLKLLGRGEPVALNLHGTELNFECSAFTSNDIPLFVFRCLLEDRPRPDAAQAFDLSAFQRIRSAWLGRRNLGQRLLQVAVSGLPSEAAARADFLERLPSVFRADAQPTK